MQVRSFFNHSLRALAAGAIATTALLAHAGMSVTHEQEMMVQPGMDGQQVRELIGEPSRVMQFPATSGSSWVYNLNGANTLTVVYIDFDTQGHVTGTSEQARVGGQFNLD